MYSGRLTTNEERLSLEPKQKITLRDWKQSAGARCISLCI